MFVLEKLPNQLHNLKIDYPQEAHKLIAKYAGMIELTNNAEVLTSILFIQEAVQSSHIEGTIATITDILDFNVGNLIHDEQISLDIQEIENYQDALKYGTKLIEETDHLFTNHLFKSLQSILLDNARGRDKLRGEFKRTQNFIGNKYNHQITYTPVSPVFTIDYMENLVQYINTQYTDLDPIVKIAIIHAQFELIHPFEDGNGRVGRIIIPLLLKKYELLETTYFYISYYLSKHRQEYINALEAISNNNNWEEWIHFFIRGVTEQAKVLISMLKELNQIKRETENKINELKTIFAIQIVDFLFQKIKFNTKYFISKTGINPNTASNLLKDLVKSGIISIEKVGSGRRSTIYRFDALYEIIKGLD